MLHARVASKTIPLDAASTNPHRPLPAFTLTTATISSRKLTLSGAVVARYSQGLNIDEPLAMLRSSATSFYHADGLGTVTSLSNAAGALAQTYAFDSIGNQTATCGSLTNSFQHTGRESDSETDLYYYRARYYDPQTGRFLSEDPTDFRAGINFYRYVRNNATNWVDPTGLAPTPSDPKLPTVPTGKAGCSFVGSQYHGGHV